MRGRRWKAELIDWAGISADDDDTLYWTALSLRELEILMPAVALWLWRTRWDNLPDAVDMDAIIGRIIKRLQGAIMIRQSPDNACVLQQSKDGITWTLLFDFGLCGLRNPATTYNVDFDLRAQWNTYNVNNFTTYAGAIVNIYPQWVYDGGGGDADRDSALCWALSQYVDAMCETAIDAIAAAIDASVQQNDIQSLILQGLALIAGGAAVFGFYPVALAAGGLALTAAALFMDAKSTVLALLADDAPYRDQDARDEVVCAMYSVLSGLTPTWALWQTALSQAGLSANAQTILDYVAQLSTSEQMFINFYGYFVSAIAIAASLSLPCVCGASWCVEFDFTISSYGGFGWRGAVSTDDWNGQQPTLATEPAATYSAGVGWVSADYKKETDLVNQRAATILVNWVSAISYDRVVMVYNLTKGNNGDHIAISGEGPTGTGLYVSQNSNPTAGADIEYEDATPRSGVVGMGLFVRSSTSGFSGAATIRAVRIYGSGTKPALFAGIPDCP